MTPSTLSLANQRGLAADSKSLDKLNTLAGKDGRAALKETARQFEALFMQELLKSMRDATMKSGLMDGEESELGTQLLDQQWAQMMTGIPGGLSEMIERQLSQQITPQAGGAAAPGAQGASPAPVARAAISRPSASQESFVAQHRDAALQVSRESGIPASFMIGQAGHETGWGRSEIRHADGSNAFNLFGIKAGAGWKGKVAEITTTEYVDGEPRKVTARFRAYDSYADSFRDYARLITENPRYAQAVESTGNAKAYATALQNAGYATDPLYASKLSRAIESARAAQQGTQG